MVEVHITSLMERLILANFSRIRSMEKVFMCGLMDRNMRVIGLMGKCKEWERIHKLMGKNILVGSWKANRVGKGGVIGLMDSSILDNSKITR